MADDETTVEETEAAEEQPEGSDVARRVSPDTGGHQFTGIAADYAESAE